MSLIVQKYGGACLATTEKITQVAKQINDLVLQGDRVAVVVSAMGSTTDDLLKLAYSMSSSPKRRELDMLLTAGERMSMSLLSIALNELGQDAISYTGSQAGILTDQSHSNARITEIRPNRVKDSLNLGKVVILAGFQGVDPISKEITTLGRGGSDTTAVAMANALDADECQILKCAPGFCSGDPDFIESPIVYDHLDYTTAAEMCFWGAEVLHYRAIELAKKTRIPLFIGDAWTRGQGTKIGEKIMFETHQVIGVNLIEACLTVSVPAENLDSGIKWLNRLVLEKQIPPPKIFASVFEDQKLRLMLHCPPEDQKLFEKSLTEAGGEKLTEDSLISVTSFGSTQSDLLERITTKLNDSSISIKKTLMSSSTLSLQIKKEDAPNAIKIVHEFVK